MHPYPSRTPNPNPNPILTLTLALTLTLHQVLSAPMLWEGDLNPHPTPTPNQVLSAPMLWDELMRGAKRDRFWKLVSTRVDLYLTQLAASPSSGTPQLVLAGMGEANRRWLGVQLASRLQAELPQAAPLLYQLTDDSLQLQQLMQVHAS